MAPECLSSRCFVVWLFFLSYISRNVERSVELMTIPMVHGLDPMIVIAQSGSGGVLPLKRPIETQGSTDIAISSRENKPPQPQSILKISTHRLTPVYRNQNQYNDDSSLESIGVYDSAIESAHVETFNPRRVSWEPTVKDHSRSQSCSI